MKYSVFNYLYLGTFDVTTFSSHVKENSICVTCHLLFTFSQGCFFEVKGKLPTRIKRNRTVIYNTDTTDSSPRSYNGRPISPIYPTHSSLIDFNVEGCIDNLPPDNYTVMVYDLDDEIQPLLEEPAVSPTTEVISVPLPSSNTIINRIQSLSKISRDIIISYTKFYRSNTYLESSVLFMESNCYHNV